jgi:hypothetical protein
MFNYAIFFANSLMVNPLKIYGIIRNFYSCAVNYHKTHSSLKSLRFMSSKKRKPSVLNFHAKGWKLMKISKNCQINFHDLTFLLIPGWQKNTTKELLNMKYILRPSFSVWHLYLFFSVAISQRNIYFHSTSHYHHYEVKIEIKWNFTICLRKIKRRNFKNVFD